jgi:hypothetical protein
MQYVIDHWDIISACLCFAISEAMALNPGWKYNGILDAALGLLKSKQIDKPKQ